MSPASSRTMPTYSPRAQVALLKAVGICWPQARPSPSSASTLLTRRSSPQVNRLFTLERTAETFEELADGAILSQVLHELDPEFSTSDLDSSHGTSKYLTNKRNIQAVYKGLFRFIRRKVPELGCQAKKFDYHAIAENPEPQGISQVTPPRVVVDDSKWLTRFSFQLLAVMIAAAVMGPDNQKYVPRIQTGLSPDVQGEIMQVIRTVQQDITNSKGEDAFDEAIDAVMEARDMDLLVEEQNASLRHELDLTKKTLSDYITRLEYLQQSHEELKYDKEKNDRELEVLRKATQDGANSAESIKVLEAQVHEQMEIIARNEETIRQFEKTKAHLESEVQRLTHKSRQNEELHDQVTEWKHKAEELEKKANTADRYKQKLESQQHIVKEVQNLQYEKTELQEQLRSIMEDRERSDRTRKAEDELTKMITQSEQHLWDERNQKNQLLRDLGAAEEELMRLRAQRSHDERYIQEQEESLQQAMMTRPQPGAQTSTFNLEDELNDASKDSTPVNHANLPLELSRLKAENELLRNTLGPGGDATLFRRELDEEKRQRAHIQQNFNEYFEKHAVAQEQIEALIKNMTGEGLVNAFDEVKTSSGWHVLTGTLYRTQAFINLRTEYLQADFEREQNAKTIKDLSAQVADQGRELLAARAMLSAAGKDTVEALNELRGTDKVIIDSLKGELDRLREEMSYTTSERDAQKSQLIEALLAKDSFRKELEAGKESPDGAQGLGITMDSEVSEANKKSSEKVEKLRARLIESRQVSGFEFPGPNKIESWPTVVAPTETESLPKSIDMAELDIELDCLPAHPVPAVLNEPFMVKEEAPKHIPISRKPKWAPGLGNKLKPKWNNFWSFKTS